MDDELINAWKSIYRGFDKPWVLFRFGTCVLLTDTKEDDDLVLHAKMLLKEWGPVVAGTPSSKYGFRFLCDQGIPGCLVTSHYPGISTYLDPSECPIEPSKRLVGIRRALGELGRAKRHTDAQTLEVIYIHKP